MLKEKEDRTLLPPISARPSQDTPVLKKRLAVVATAIVGAFLVSVWPFPSNVSPFRFPFDHLKGRAANCPQTSPKAPEVNLELWERLGSDIQTDAFKAKAVEWLSGAVQIPTESFDDMGPVGEDPRWEVHAPFQEYLLQSFPNVHASLKLTKVNTYGLWYEWTGSDASLKPILLAAHQDVVPVEPTTVDRWTHGPYSGHFDGNRVWGRGSSDDKGALIAILSSIETLLDSGFQPARTIVLSFGFDEERGGPQGAGHLAPAILEVYGEDSFAFVIDEGGGFAEQYGTIFATPGIAEKGALDVQVQVTAPGGHSSVPPSHTSIGMLSAALVHIENNPYEVVLTRDNPFFKTLQCTAEHGKDVPKALRKSMERAPHSKRALRAVNKLILENPVFKSLVGTTQAVDIIHGGVKSNALPEQAWAIVNHRISAVSSVEDTKAHDTKVLESVAKKYNLTYTSFGNLVSDAGAASSGTLSLGHTSHASLEPAPVTPTGSDAAAYQLLSGTIKATYNAHRSLQGDDNIAIRPGMSTGNTDTRFYWKLSRHIFRYNHSQGGDKKNPVGGIHTINESIGAEAYLEMIRFFITLLLNADESTTI